MGENGAETGRDTTYADPMVAAEKVQGSGVPTEIVRKVEDYLVNGRPGLNGSLEKGLTVYIERQKVLGGRYSLCGFATPYVTEVVEAMNKTEEHHLAGVGIQARMLGVVLPEDLYRRRRFRAHGFSIVLDRDLGKRWLIDTTFIQYVDATEGGGQKMLGSDYEIGDSNNSDTSKVAKALLKDGFIEMTRENFAAFISLMVADGTIDDAYTKRVAESLLEGSGQKLHKLITVGKATPNGSLTGDWQGAIKPDIW